MPVVELQTERLLLRPWRPEDEAPMIAINRDPEVIRYLDRPIDEAAVTALHGDTLGRPPPDPKLMGRKTPLCQGFSAHQHQSGARPWPVRTSQRVLARMRASRVAERRST